MTTGVTLSSPAFTDTHHICCDTCIVHVVSLVLHRAFWTLNWHSSFCTETCTAAWARTLRTSGSCIP